MASLQVNIDATGAKRGASDFQQATDAIKQSATQAASASDSAATAFTKQGAASATASRQAEQMVAALQRQERALQTVGQAVTIATNVFGALGLAMGVREVIATADSYQQLTGRLKLVTSSTAELTQVQERLFQIAQQTRSGLEGTVSLYTSLSRNAKALGADQATLLSVTKTINQAMAVSGVSAATASAGLQQLGQAFASGVLRGDEFNSVMENTPRLAQAIADGMGKTVGELRALAEAGKLTAETVLNALKSQRETIDREFGQLPVTVGQALTVLGNSIARFIGDADAATGASTRLAIAIQGIAGAIDSFHRSSAQQQDLQNLTTQFDFAAQQAKDAAERVRQASTIGIDVSKSQVVREELQRLTSTLAGLQETAERINKLGGKASTGSILDPLTAKALGQAYQAAGGQVPAALTAMGGATAKFTAEQIKAQKETQTLLDRLKEHAATVNLSGAALAKYRAEQALAETGSRDLADQVYKAVLIDEQAKAAKEAHTKAIQGQSKAEREAAAAKKQYTKDIIDANLLVNKLANEKQKLDIADNKANVESLRTLQDQGLALQEEGRLLAASLGPKAAIRDIEKEIALARIERTRQTELTRAKEHELTVAEEEQINTNAELAKSLALATDAQNRQADALKNSILSTGDVSNAFKGLAQGFFSGTQSLKKLVPDFFKGLAITAFGKFIEQKVFSLDQPLINNVNGLMGQGGILSQIFSFGGNQLGSLFGSAATQSIDSIINSWAGGGGSVGGGGSGFFGSLINLFGGAGSNAGSAFGEGASDSIDAIINARATGAGSSDAGGLFGGLFGGGSGSSSGAGGFLGALGIGVGLAQVGSSFSKGKYGSGAGGVVGGAIGAYFGGPQGAALGLQIGSAFGSLFDGFFKHVPTKGTRVRKTITEFLDNIGVTFADEVNSKNYFFKETKQLAEDMFGGDFLAASKKILDDKVGPELANQLKALGTFITADQASKLGKSVEQTGVTFGNLLVANLGIDAIPAAITEIVQKSNLTLDDLVDKLNELFSAKTIGTDFFKETIQGAVAIFSGALPDAIGVSKIALKSFAEDGTFDLEKFKKAVEGATSQFDLAVQTFLDSVNNNAPGEAAAKAFGEGLKRGLDQLARDAFLQDFIENKLFAGIDFSDGLDSSEIDTLQQRTREASIQADALAKALDNTGDAVDGLSTKIRDLNAQLQDLANQRVQIQVDLAGQLGSIGALTPTQVIAAREQPLIPTVDRALNARSPIGTAPFASFSDDELQAANDALKEMGDLAVDRFNAESQAAEAALQDRIAAINTETQSTINAINQQTQATQDGIRAQFDAQQANGQRVIDGLQKQKDIQSRIFQDRIDGLQEELQAAQEFRQVSESIQQTINSLALSNSPLFKSEKLAFLQRQAGELRSDKSADAIQKLSQNLASQLQIGQDTLSPEQFAAQFTSVIDELQTLRDKTGQQGAKAEDIQRNIEALQTQQTATLERIDAQIASQQQYLQSLSQNENNAIAAAQKAGAARITAAQEAGAARVAAAQAETKAAIDAYRVVIVARLNALAAARDEILKEQAFRLKNAADLTAEQLTQLIDINVNTRAMKDLITSFLAANAAPPITPAATGFQGIVDRPRLFLAGEAGRESVSITPVGQGQNGGGGNVTFAPSISVTMQGSSNTEQDGKRLATAISQGLLAEWRRGALGKEIRDFVKR